MMFSHLDNNNKNDEKNLSSDAQKKNEYIKNYYKKQPPVKYVYCILFYRTNTSYSWPRPYLYEGTMWIRKISNLPVNRDKSMGCTQPSCFVAPWHFHKKKKTETIIYK